MLGAAVGRRMCEEVEQERVGERVSGVGCAVREEGVARNGVYKPTKPLVNPPDDRGGVGEGTELVGCKLYIYLREGEKGEEKGG